MVQRKNVDMANRRAHIIFQGTVQGVGFRWTAESVAISLGITGWVRNCPDGNVEAICEGKKEDIDTFIQKMKSEMGHYIRSSNVNWQEATGEFDAFGIKFSY